MQSVVCTVTGLLAADRARRPMAGGKTGSSAALRPNLFLIGAPKCGTTTMHDLLAQHPEVFMPWVKELHFFGRDLATVDLFDDEDDYLSLYAEGAGARVLGDASPSYLYSASAPDEVYRFSPEARILAMVRDPCEMILSLHAQRVFTGKETERDPARALSRERDPAAEAAMLARPVDGDAVPYRTAVRFAEYLDRWLRTFGPERVHVVVLDDLRDAPVETMRRVYTFLGVDPSFAPEPTVKNPSKEPRNQAIGRLVRAVPMRWRLGIERALPSAARDKLIGAVTGLISREAPREPVDPRLAQALREEFAGEVSSLERLLGRELPWPRPTAPRA